MYETYLWILFWEENPRPQYSFQRGLCIDIRRKQHRWYQTKSRTSINEKKPKKEDKAKQPKEKQTKQKKYCKGVCSNPLWILKSCLVCVTQLLNFVFFLQSVLNLHCLLFITYSTHLFTLLNMAFSPECTVAYRKENFTSNIVQRQEIMKSINTENMDERGQTFSCYQSPVKSEQLR